MEARPRISVITALRDEESHLPALLEALACQTLAVADWEIVAAVAGSDRTAEILRVAQGRADLPRIEIVPNPEGLAAGGLNRALALARGDFIARLDGHAEPAADYLERVLARLEEGEFSCVGGPQRSEGLGSWGRAYARVVASPAGHGGAAYRRAAGGHEDEGGHEDAGAAREADTVYLGAWPRRRLLAVGAFDESLARNQDDELAMRLRAAGGKILLDPAIRVLYRPRESLGAVLRQYFAYGYWKPRVLARHPSALAARHLLPALVLLWLVAASVFFALTLSPAALLSAAAWPLAVLILLAPALGGAGPVEILRSFLLAATMTPAYGLGFILGTPQAFGTRPRLLPAGEVGA